MCSIVCANETWRMGFPEATEKGPLIETNEWQWSNRLSPSEYVTIHNVGDATRANSQQKAAISRFRTAPTFAFVDCKSAESFLRGRGREREDWGDWEGMNLLPPRRWNGLKWISPGNVSSCTKITDRSRCLYWSYVKGGERGGRRGGGRG